MKPVRLKIEETAGRVRERLAQAFPGVPFGVRINRAGDAIYIAYTAGPPLRDVEEIIGTTHREVSVVGPHGIRHGYAGEHFIFVEREAA